MFAQVAGVEWQIIRSGYDKNISFLNPFPPRISGGCTLSSSQFGFSAFDTFDGAKPRFLNRGKKRRSVLALRLPRASARGVEWVDSLGLVRESA